MGSVDIGFHAGELIVGNFLSHADFCFGSVVLDFVVVRLHVELNTCHGDEDQENPQNESPVFDGRPLEALSVRFGEGRTRRRVLSCTHVGL